MIDLDKISNTPNLVCQVNLNTERNLCKIDNTNNRGK